MPTFNPRPIDVTVRANNATKTGFEAVMKDASSFASGLTETLNKPFEILQGLLAFEVLGAVKDFFTESVSLAGESAAVWSRVGQAVANTGITFQNVAGDLKDQFQSIADKTRFSEKDISDAFATLLNVTDDYRGSLKNIGLVTDLAIAKHLDLNTAATLVGRVIDGDTQMLKRYGIVVADDANALEKLREMTAGYAERDGASLQGRLEQIANKWEDLKIQVGETITGTDSAGAAAGRLVTVLGNLTEWLEKNRHGFRDWVDDYVSGARLVGRSIADSPLGHFFGSTVGPAVSLYDRRTQMIQNQLAPAPSEDWGQNDPAYQAALAAERARAKQATDAQIAANAAKAAAEHRAEQAKAAEAAEKKHVDDLRQEYDYLVKLGQLDGNRLSDYTKMGAIQAEMMRVATDKSLPASVRAGAADFLGQLDTQRKADAQKALDLEKQLAKSGSTLYDLGAKRPTALLPTLTDIANGGPKTTATHAEGFIQAQAQASPVDFGSVSQGGFFQHAGTSFVDMMGGPGAFKGVDTSLGDLEDHMESFTGGALANFFTTWQQGIADVIQGHESLGVAILQSARKAIGGAMAAEAQQTFFKAATAAALGFTDPAMFLQAGKLFAIASAELAAASLLSGGGGGGGSYSGGGGGTLSASGMQQNNGQMPSKTTVVLKGNGINFKNPDDLTALRDAIQELNITGEIDFLVEGN